MRWFYWFNVIGDLYNYIHQTIISFAFGESEKSICMPVEDRGEPISFFPRLLALLTLAIFFFCVLFFFFSGSST